MSDFNPIMGDVVHVRVFVSEKCSCTGYYVGRAMSFSEGIKFVFRELDIVHIEKRKPAVGDWVQDTKVYKNSGIGRIIAIDDDFAWVRFKDSKIVIGLINLVVVRAPEGEA